eukprot:NODE_2881_length_1098_cov_19.395615_g2642_i0.p1 GENE.NODE_2881_length_1098_cov_19.395615_g2642_i0~~NODE_2881_length_1098_cov_19.395615_g2642_i0.p1  ORF type:complete len:187 (+),score=35.45 NODE_2881_length_1098_cov_19.395615_g2642_i0:285-845(+)
MRREPRERRQHAAAGASRPMLRNQRVQVLLLSHKYWRVLLTSRTALRFLSMEMAMMQNERRQTPRLRFLSLGKNEEAMEEIAEAPRHYESTRMPALAELEKDTVFPLPNMHEDIDISILTSALNPQVEEEDILWEPNQLFNQLSSEIQSERDAQQAETGEEDKEEKEKEKGKEKLAGRERERGSGL